MDHLPTSHETAPYNGLTSDHVPNRPISRRDMGRWLGVAAAACCGLPATVTTSPLHAVEDVAEKSHALDRWAGELESHRIVDISLRRVPLRWHRFVGKNARLDDHGRGPDEAVIVLTTDKGATGWGAGWLGDAGESRAKQLQAELRDRPLTELFDLGSGITEACPRAFDFAMHDLAGNILDQPVYALLNPALVDAKPEAFPSYSGMIYFDDLETEAYPSNSPQGIDRVIVNAIADYQLGYRQMKIKIGRGNRWMEHDAGLKRDIEITHAIQEALPDVTLLVDANDGYSLDDAKRYLEGVGDIELLWFEEPFREEESNCRALHAFMKEQGRKTYLADGEADPDQALLTDLMRSGALDVYLTDIVGLGVTPWRRKMQELKEFGVLASPHAFGSQLKTYYTAHLAAAYGNTLTIEGVPCRSDEVDWNGYALNKDGGLAPPAKSGFGMRLKGV